MSKAVPKYRILFSLRVIFLPESSLNARQRNAYQNGADQNSDDNDEDCLSKYLPHQAASKCTHSFSDPDLPSAFHSFGRGKVHEINACQEQDEDGNGHNNIDVRYALSFINLGLQIDIFYGLKEKYLGDTQCLHIFGTILHQHFIDFLFKGHF